MAFKFLNKSYQGKKFYKFISRQKICCEYSVNVYPQHMILSRNCENSIKALLWGASKEYPQHVLLSGNKKNINNSVLKLANRQLAVIDQNTFYIGLSK